MIFTKPRKIRPDGLEAYIKLHYISEDTRSFSIPSAYGEAAPKAMPACSVAIQRRKTEPDASDKESLARYFKEQCSFITDEIVEEMKSQIDPSSRYDGFDERILLYEYSDEQRKHQWSSIPEEELDLQSLERVLQNYHDELRDYARHLVERQREKSRREMECHAAFHDEEPERKNSAVPQAISPACKPEVQERQKTRSRPAVNPSKAFSAPVFKKPASLETGKAFQVDESFSRRLQRLMIEKKLTAPQCYKRAHIDRRLFSRICCSDDYHPRKNTALALAIALELNLEETKALLETAGYTLSHSILFDVIVEFYISKQFYDVFSINEVLYEHDQMLLGS